MKPTILASILLPTAAAALLLCGKPASAQVVLNMQKPFQSGTTGTTYQFFGTITNFGPSAIYLTGDYFTPSSIPAGVTLDDSPFYNAPFQLSSGGMAGSSYTGALFNVTVSPTTAPGFYSGLFSLTGGTDFVANQYTTLNTNGFSISAAVPEASTTVSFGLLLALGGFAYGARKKKLASAA